MPKYGKIMSEELVTSDTMLRGYKPIEYEKIPETFDQTTHYVMQRDPVEENDRIYVGIEIYELEAEGEGFDEDVF